MQKKETRRYQIPRHAPGRPHPSSRRIVPIGLGTWCAAIDDTPRVQRALRRLSHVVGPYAADSVIGDIIDRAARGDQIVVTTTSATGGAMWSPMLVWRSDGAVAPDDDRDEYGHESQAHAAARVQAQHLYADLVDMVDATMHGDVQLARSIGAIIRR